MSLFTMLTRNKGDDQEAEPVVLELQQGTVLVAALDDGEELWFDAADVRAALDGLDEFGEAA